MTVKIGVLASTKGTDMQALIDRAEEKKLDAVISVVISNKKDAYALERARKHNIEALFIDPAGKTREEFDREVAFEFDRRGVELVLLIGYMRYLSKEFVEKYRNRIINVHPSLLPAFAGGMDKNVHQAVLDCGCKITGCTIHFVDEGADTGPIIIQKAVFVEENDTADSLKDKVQALEKDGLVEAVKLFGEGKLKVEGKIVRVG